MTPLPCPRETELWDAVAAGRWPDAADADLQAHVAACAACRDLALVAGSLRRDASDLRRDATPPSSAIVWWRAQMRARQEAARAADRPISVVQALAIACGAGLFFGLLGSVATPLRQSTQWLASWPRTVVDFAAQFAALDVTSPWVLVPAALIGLSLIVTPVAIYAILAEE